MNERTPDNELANVIRKLQNEIDEKALILTTLRSQYDPTNIIWGEYLKTSAWQEMRQKVFRRDGFVCVACGESKNLNVHHITYERLGAEELSDLVTLCQRCHENVHAGKALVKYTTSDIFTSSEYFLFFYAWLLANSYLDFEDDLRMVPDYFEKYEARDIVHDFHEGAGIPDWLLERFVCTRNEVHMQNESSKWNINEFKAQYLRLLCEVNTRAINHQIDRATRELCYPFVDSYKEELQHNIEVLTNQRDKFFKITGVLSDDPKG